jgi:hypothetical protein
MDRPEAAGRRAGCGAERSGPEACGAERSRAEARGAERSRTGRARAWLCAAAVLAAVVLAGCGSIPASSTGAASGGSPSPSPSASPAASPGAAQTQAALCQHTATVTGLEVVRNRIKLVPQTQGTFPDQVTVATPARARAVARALCALPLLPKGVLNCPALMIGTTYTLEFTADGQRLPAASIEATGCEIVTGVGPARWAAKSPGFWRTLATTLNVSPPGRTAFTGAGTSSCQPSNRPDQANGCPVLSKPDTGAVS